MEQLKICILTDRNDLTLAITSRVRYCGAVVTFAANAEEVLTRISAHEADVVITDYRMKERLGVNHILMVKKQKPFTPMIIIKGYAEIVSSSLASRLTIHDYFIQPMALDSLPRVIAMARSCFSLN